MPGADAAYDAAFRQSGVLRANSVSELFAYSTAFAYQPLPRGRQVAIINSMTPGERQFPKTINGSRKKRIAAGAGLQIQDVNRLLRQFAQTRKLMKGLGSGAKAMKRLAARMPGLAR